ncbi:MAG TPA: cytochrome P450 [Polyangia bacterium]|jgi:cytochrome P450|nr:cytochrome P450 [Polyangia bacterium]
MSMTSTLLAPLRQRILSRQQGYPLVGQLPQVMADPLHTILNIVRAHPGQVATLRLGPANVYLVSEPDQVAEVLSDSGRRFGKQGSMWNPLRRLFGEGLLTAEGDPWMRTRRMMQPIFVSKALAALSHHVLQVVEDEAAALQPAAERGDPIDLRPRMMHLTQQILVRTLFGTSGDIADQVGDAIMEAFRLLSVRIFLYFLPNWTPLPGEFALRRVIRVIDNGVAALLGERRQKPGAPSDLMSLLLEARDEETKTGMNDRQLRDEMVVLLIAGTETTANTLTWFWYLLDQHPDVDRRVRAELDAVLGDRPPTLEDLQKLTYTKMVLQETLRLYVPGWILPRGARDDVDLGGRRIPKDAAVLLCAYATHHDARWWKDPERFDPERFTPEEVARRPRYAFYPFGGGQRQCIGMQFAYIEALYAVAILARKFRFRSVSQSPAEPEVATTLKPPDHLKMSISLAEPPQRARVAGGA